MKNETLEKLFREHFNEAKLYVCSLSRNAALAEDVVCESFYKAFVSIDEEKVGFKYWLFKVCRNSYFDHLRKNKRLTGIDDATTADNDGDILSGIIEKEEYRALYRAITLLKDAQKEAVMLYYFEGLSVAEIAGITEQSIDNVKVILFRARAKLKSILEDNHEF